MFKNPQLFRTESSRTLAPKMLRLMLLPAMATFVFVVSYKGSTAVLRVEKQLLTTSQAMIERIDEVLYDHYLDIRMIATEQTTRYLAQKSEPGARKVLTDIRSASRLRSPWERIYLTDAEGKINYALNKDEQGTNVTERKDLADAFALAAAGVSYHSDAMIGENGKPRIVFSAPLTNDDGSFAGSVIGYADWGKSIAAVMERTEHPAYLYNKDGSLISANSKNVTIRGIDSTHQSLFSLFEKAHAAEELGKVKVRGDGQSATQIAFATQRGLHDFYGNNWVLVTLKPISRAQQILQHGLEALGILL